MGLTVGIDKADRCKEGNNVEAEPETNFHNPAAMLQVLITLVALELHAQQHQRQKTKEELQSSSQTVNTSFLSMQSEGLSGH